MPGHLRESRDSAAPEVPVDHRPEERVVPLLVLVRETGLEPVALEIDDPSELIRALQELARECLQIGGREQLDQLRQLERKRRGGDRVDWCGRLRVPLRGEFVDLADVDWLPIPRQQRVELMSLGSPGHDALQHVGEPSHRIDAVHLRGLDQGHRD